jgi:hypothetical protein
MLRARQSAARWRMRGPAPGIRPAGAMPVPVPYDYGVSFDLDGVPGALHEAALVTAPDGTFVATAVGYGFSEQRGHPLLLKKTDPPPATPVLPTDITLAEIPLTALIDGFRLSPQFGESTFTLGAQVPPEQINRMLQRVKPPSQPTFLFSVIDTATGRELQDEPTHNLASLGIANGERPFRRLAYPISFLPRSSLRIQIIEQSAGTQGTLFVVFYGYRIPLGANCPEPVARSLTRPVNATPQRQALPPAEVVPFDYVASLDLTGTAGARQASEITISVSNEFVATAIGYGLATGDLDVTPALNTPTVDLQSIKLGAFPLDALREGIRIQPELHRIAFQDNGTLANSLPRAVVSRLFERINRPEDVSFTYSIFDSGTGHDLQNIELHNIAGLGIASGERPFKQLAVPLRLQSRSTLRVTVTEQFGRGRLYIVLQGYKRLGSPTPPPRGRRA